jgi:hypothetical protein
MCIGIICAEYCDVRIEPNSPFEMKSTIILQDRGFVLVLSHDKSSMYDISGI